MSNQTLGSLIRDRRRAKGLTQAQLARELGVDQSRISQYERDETVPSKYIVELDRVLDIHPQDLMAHIFDLFNGVERELVEDPNLSRKEQDALLSAYGHLTGRPSVENASIYRSMADGWRKLQPPDAGE